MPRATRARFLTGFLSCGLATVLLLPEAVAAGPELRFDRLSLRDGLSQSAISDIVQDPQGFLWFATLDGLNRYDGYRFKVYRNDPDDPHSLGDNDLRTLRVVQSELWIGTHGGGLNRFDPSTDRFTRYRHDPDDSGSLSHNSVSAILEGSGGVVWIGTNRGLNRLEPGGSRFTSYIHNPEDVRSLSHDVIWAIHEDRSGQLWLGTDGGGLNRFDPSTETFAHYRHDSEDPDSLSDNHVWAITEDRAGSLWVSTFSGGLNRLDPSTGAFTRYRHDPNDRHSLSHDNVKAVYEDPEGRLWVGTNGGGVNLFDPERERFLPVRHDPSDPRSLSHDNVWTIFEDRMGILWVGTNGGGLNRFDPSTEVFSRYRHRPEDSESVSDNNIRSLLEGRSGEIWVGTNGRGLNRFDPTEERFTVYRHDPQTPQSLSNDNIWAIHQDPSGRLWVGTNAGLDLFDPAAGRFSNYSHDPENPESLSNNRVWAIHAGPGEHLWVGTDGGGLHSFDPSTERFTRYLHDPTDPESLSSDNVWVLLEDRAGQLWVGTRGGGLNRFDPETRRCVRYTHRAADRESLSANSLWSLHEDSDGILWVGTNGGGLNRFEPETETFRAYRQKDGLPNDVIYGIVEDEANHLWLSTNQGLARFDPDTETFRNFDVSDGLLGNEFNAGAYLKSRTGRFYFGGIDGLTAFYPNRLEIQSQMPPVVLTSFKKYNQEMRLETAPPYLQALDLSHRDDLISFEVAALDFTAPQKNRYAYRMEGLDEDWIDLGSKRDLTFTDLDAGRYTLRVRGSNHDGIWNEEGMALAITVESPPWRSGWAMMLYALGALAILGGGVYAQRRELRRERQVSHRLRQVDRLKDEFLANTSHELRTPLYGISGLAESLIDGATGELPEETRGHLAMIVASGRRLTALVDDILDFSKLRHRSLRLDLKAVDLRAVVDIVLTLLRPLASGKDLAFHNAVDSDSPQVMADENRLQQILHNLVGNAIKFTEVGEVVVQAVPHPSQLQIQVRDTGIGIAKEAQERIFEAFVQEDGTAERVSGGTGLGLAVTRQLVELHGSELQLESTVGVGSTFSFQLPIAEGEPSRLASNRPMAATSALLTEDIGSSPVAGAASAAPQRATVLVVDDEPVNRQVLVNQLMTEGYRVGQAANGSEALGWLEKHSADLVLLDVMMPRMSGYEVCRALRERFPIDQLPILFLTAKSRSSDLVAGLAAGANDYLPKPISKSELLARVDTHLTLRSMNRKLAELVGERTAEVSQREQLIDALEAKNSELARFNYSVAHDLKNPLTTITNFLGLARQDASAGQMDRLERDFDRLQTAADHLQLLLDDLFELSRIGLQPNASEPVAFEELVQSALSALATELRARGAEVQVASDLPVVLGDRERLQELLRHLVDNALRYSKPSQTPSIEIGIRTSDAEQTFYVRDQGIGVEPRYQQRIFDLFARLDPGTSSGTGLGLALAKRVAEAHGGRIWVESKGRGHGSTFCFTLPVPAS